MPEKDLSKRTARLLERLKVLQEQRRQSDILLEKYIRLGTRLLWLCQQQKAEPPVPPGSDGPGATLLKRLDLDLEDRKKEVTLGMSTLQSKVDWVAAELDRVQESFSVAGRPHELDNPVPTSLQDELLRFVFKREELIGVGDTLKVTGGATGVARRSRLFFIDIVNKTGRPTVHLIAKFDEPKRAQREWEAVQELRLLQLPQEIILPEPYCHGDDGVILYRAARTPNSPRSQTFSEYLRKNLAAAPRHCAKCLDLAFGALRKFYEMQPGQERGGGEDPLRQWRDALPETWSDLRKEDVARLSEVCGGHWVGVDWKQATSFDHHFNWKLPRSLPNPVAVAKTKLQETTPRILLSRIHGDLNLTNLMVCSYGNGAPEKVFVIDLANTESDRPAALDFARLEVALWLEGFLEVARFTLGSAEEEKWLADLIALRDVVDGRRQHLPETLHLERLRELGALVTHLRNLAFTTLAPANPQVRVYYILEDYFSCLYFTFLSMLRHEALAADPVQVRAMLVGAALTLQVLDEAPRYSEDARDRYDRPWEAPPPRDEAAGSRRLS